MDDANPQLFDPASVVLTDGVITLRCLDHSDLRAHLAGEDEDQVRWLNEGHRSTVERVGAWIGRNRQEWRTGGPRRHLGVRDAGSDTLIGNAEAHLALPELESWEVNLSYAVFPAWRGHGVAVRAVRLLCDWLGSATDARTAVIRVTPENEHSHAVALAAGFERQDERVTASRGSEDGLVRYTRSLRPDG